MAEREEVVVKHPGLEDLAECCIAFILSRTCPRDVARLARVNTIFREAASSDIVWERMLPPYYREVLDRVPNAPASSIPMKEIYELLTKRVVFENGCQDLWLDRETGGVCQSIGARGLKIWGGDNEHRWCWTKREESRFEEVVELKGIYRISIQGIFHCDLPSGTYTLSWRLAFKFGTTEFQGFKDSALRFSLRRSGGESVDLNNVLTTKDKTPRETQTERLPLWREGDKNSWIEIDGGEFRVPIGDDFHVELSFSMTQVTSFLKRGMVMDSVVIRPTHVVVKERERKKALQRGKAHIIG